MILHTDEEKTTALECRTNSYPSIMHMQSRLCSAQLARPVVLMYVDKVIKRTPTVDICHTHHLDCLAACLKLLDTTSNKHRHGYIWIHNHSQPTKTVTKLDEV